MSAGHWMKVMKGTPKKAALSEIRRYCGCSKGDAFLAFFEMYCYFDDATADGFVAFFRKEDADEITGIKGFGEALEVVGWVRFDSDGARIYDWEKHNGRSAKRRILDSERQNRCRSKK